MTLEQPSPIAPSRPDKSIDRLLSVTGELVIIAPDLSSFVLARNPSTQDGSEPLSSRLFTVSPFASVPGSDSDFKPTVEIQVKDKPDNPVTTIPNRGVRLPRGGRLSLPPDHSRLQA